MPERVPLSSASGRVLAEQILSPIHLPAFDNSAMDGYAVRASDMTGAGAESPVRLRLCGKLAAGETLAGQVHSGTCARLFTGSPLPSGADAVVIQENTQVDPERPDTVLFLTSVRAGENVRRRGEDVKQGSVISEAGGRLTASRAGLLAAAGLTQVNVGCQPIVGVLATGSELTEGGQPLAPGRIYESDRLTLAALLARCGGVPRTYPLVPDTLTATQAALETAFAECDLLVTSGGVSVGEMDWIKPAFAQLGGRLDFWKVPSNRAGRLCLAALGRNFCLVCPATRHLPSSRFSFWYGQRLPAGKALCKWRCRRIWACWPSHSQTQTRDAISCASKWTRQDTSIPPEFKDHTGLVHWRTPMVCSMSRRKPRWLPEAPCGCCAGSDAALAVGAAQVRTCAWELSEREELLAAVRPATREQNWRGRKHPR